MSPFRATEHENYLHLEFHIPESSNALSLEAARALKPFFKTKKPIVVTSAHPRLFCSGGNLSDYKKLKGKAPGLKINREIEKHLDAFAAIRAPKLAIVEGDVLGGGIEWLARFDYRWSVPSAYFAFWQRRIGLSTGWGGGRAWAKKIGEESVRRLLLEGRLLSAETALREGLCDRLLPAWKIRKEAWNWAKRMSSVPPELGDWSAKSEAKVFDSLWMGPRHKATLERWKG